MKAQEAQEVKEGKSSAPPPNPKLAFQPADNAGGLAMAFNSGMAGLEFINEIGASVGAKGAISELFADEEDDDEETSIEEKKVRRRLQEAEQEIGFDLSQYMAFDLRRGDEDSA